MVPTSTETYYSNTSSIKVKPESAGVYAFLLKVSDMAGNSEYARQYCIYDPESRIDIIHRNKSIRTMFVSSATNESDYKWQNNTNKIVVSFKDHFQNRIQTTGGFLNKIDITPEIGSLNYFVTSIYDDLHSIRSTGAIHNVNGIINFEYVGKKTVADQKVPTTGWISIPNSNLTSESVVIHDGNTDGNSYTVWVRAHDIMGNRAIDNVTVYFDTTPPRYSEKENVKVQTNINKQYKTRYVCNVLQDNSP